MNAQKPQWVFQNHLTWNTHMDRTVTPQVWRWIRVNLPRIHVIYFQEVSDLPNLRRVLGDDWEIVPEKRHKRSTSYVAYRKRRFGVPLVTTFRDISFGSRWDRSVVGVSVMDRRSNRRCTFGSIHTDPLGEGFQNANWRARRRHIKQTRAWVSWISKVAARHPQGVQVVGGDVNERLNIPVHGRLSMKTAQVLFARKGFVAAHTVTDGVSPHLDDVFARETEFLEIESRRQFRPPLLVQGRRLPGSAEFDHDLVFVRTRVKVAA